jgi:hypothetical protein
MNGEKPSVKDLLDKWSCAIPIKHVAHYVFTEERDFAAFDAALEFSKGRGMSCGPLDGDNPVACAFGDFHIGKWHTISKEHYGMLDGVILSGDFRCGPCVLVDFLMRKS